MFGIFCTEQLFHLNFLIYFHENVYKVQHKKIFTGFLFWLLELSLHNYDSI